jgi:polyisoprenoid-binding protein YceI
MKKFVTFLTLSVFAIGAFAQVYKTSTGTVDFISSTPAEDIAAKSSKVKAALDSKSGVVQFAISVNSFQFKKSLMQKHFQENYMETSKYPKSSFKGKITDSNAIKWDQDGIYKVKVKGTLKMHGVSKVITIPGQVIIKEGKPTLKAAFTIKPTDYKIKIPTRTASKIAKDVAINVNCACN